jgi:hypothetical protein
MDAIFSRFITGCRDYAALIGPPADNYWFTAQIGAIEKFDRDEESVHVHVKNVCDGGRGKIFSACVESAESS